MKNEEVPQEESDEEAGSSQEEEEEARLHEGAQSDEEEAGDPQEAINVPKGMARASPEGKQN